MVSVKFITSATNGIITRATKFARKNFNITDDIAKVGARQKTSSFRDNELFKEFKEVDEIVPIYGLDELPLASSLNPAQHRFSNQITSQILDTDISRTKLIGSDKVVFEETLYINSSYANNMMIKYMDNGYSFRDTANIFNGAKGFYQQEYIDDAFKLLEEYPLEYVLKLMPEGILNPNYGRRYSKGLLGFIANNPGKKSMVVVKNDGIEFFDKVAADNFKVFELICKDDKEIETILKACRCVNKEGMVLAQDELCSLAVDILNKNKTWTNIDSLIFNNFLKMPHSKLENVQFLDKALLKHVKALYEKGLSSEEILLKLNHLKNG